MARGRGRGRVGGAHGGGHGGGRKAPGRGRGVGGGLGAPRGDRQVSRAANAAASTEYDPGIREAREEIAGSRKRQADLGQWYAQLASDYQGAEDAGAKALGAVGSITSQQQAEASQRSGTDQAELSSQDAALSKLIGAAPNSDSAGLSKIAAAGAAAEQARVAQATPLTAEQANFVGQLGADKAASRLSGIEARQEEGRRREKLKTNLGALRKEKGAARVTDRQKLEESERSYATELAQLKLARREARTAEQAAAASAALAQLKASHEEREDAIANRQSQERIGVERTNAKISAKNARTSARSAKATAKHYEKENNGTLTTAEKRDRNEHKADATAAAKALLGVKVPKGSKQWAQFEAALIEKLGSSYAAQAAEAVAKLKKEQARLGFAKRTAKKLSPSF